MKYLLDSNIIIYHLNGDPIATSFICNNVGSVAISRITFIEVMSCNYSAEEGRVVEDFLNSFAVYDTDYDISKKCLENRKIKKIKIPDNIIAATAQTRDMTLVTRNIADFQSLNLQCLDIFQL